MKKNLNAFFNGGALLPAAIRRARADYGCAIRRALLCSCSLACLATGCMEDIKPQRETRNYGSFGTELYNIVYDNSVHSQSFGNDAFLSTFRAQRDKFINAVDTTAPEPDLDALNQVFVNIVPLYENMLYPGTLRKIAVVIDEIRNDPNAVQAVTWLAESPQLLQNPEMANPLQRIFSYPNLSAITDELLNLVLKNASGQRNATNQLLKEISIATSTLEPNSNPGRFSRRLIDLLITPSDDYAPQSPYTPQIATKLDDKGWPQIAPRNGNAAFTPFVDANGDGVADGNAVGFYTLSNGALIAPFEYFGDLPKNITPDSSGILTLNNIPLFETFDLQKTPIAYLLREGDALLADTTLDILLRQTQKLLGPPQTYYDKNGEYTGFPKDSGAVQLLTALITTLDHDSVGPNFEAAIELLSHHKNTVARIVFDIDKILDIIDETPSNFSADNNLIDRLLPELRTLANTPGFMADFFEALDDPRAARIAPCLAELAQRQKTFIKVDENGDYEKCFQTCNQNFNVGSFERMDCIRSCPTNSILGTQKADHSKPESVENRSLFQRITHLMWETSETPYNVTAQSLTVGDIDLTAIAQGFGTLIQFDNLAEAYLLTITGDLHLVDHISNTFISIAGLIGDDGTSVAKLLTTLTQNMFDLTLSVNPTTAEVTRLFNKSIISSQSETYRFDLNIATCRSGYKCLQVNADTLYAVEAVGLIDALYPLVKVFNDHKVTAVLARMMSIVFEYYTTKDVTYIDAKGDPLPLYPSDFRSLEPMLIRALDETSIVADFGALGDALLNIQLSDGSKLTHRFEKFIAYLLTPDNRLRNIKGQAATEDPMGNIVAPLSPAYLYIDALRDIGDFLDDNPTVKNNLKTALRHIANIIIKTQKNTDNTITFEKPAGIQLIADTLKLLHNFYTDKTNDGTRNQWIHQEAIPNILDLVSGRLLYAYFRLFNDLDANPQGLEAFRKFILHIMESGNTAPTHLTGAAYALSALILEQNNLYALLKNLSSPLNPDRKWTTQGFPELSFVITLLTCVDAFNECDPTRAFNKVFYNLFETASRPRMNIVRLLDVAESLLRQSPGSTAQRNASDQKLLLDFVHDLFTDDDRGVERIYGVIDFTIWGNDRRPKNWKPEDASWQIPSHGEN